MNLNKEQLLCLKEKANASTGGNRYVINDNDGMESCYRPLWCVRNDAYDSCDEMEQPFEATINYGTKSDAEFIADANPIVISQIVDRLIAAEDAISVWKKEEEQNWQDKDSPEYNPSLRLELKDRVLKCQKIIMDSLQRDNEKLESVLEIAGKALKMSLHYIRSNRGSLGDVECILKCNEALEAIGKLQERSEG
jgi:hypothetical protein